MSDAKLVLAFVAVVAIWLEIRMTRTELMKVLDRHETELEQLKGDKRWALGVYWGMAALCGAASVVTGFVVKVLLH